MSKELSAFSVFIIDNFNHKGYLKTIFELRTKAKVSTNFIYKCTRFVFWFLPGIKFAELWKFRYWILQLVYHDFVSCVIHKHVNLYSYSYYLHQYNLVFVKASMGVTTCWINHALVYSTDPTSLRFHGQVIKSLVPVLLLTNNWEKLLILKLNYQCLKYGSMLYDV